MLLGPVFRADLLRTARRRRYYAIRLLYGLLLLAMIWLGHAAKFGGRSSATIAEAADFADSTFFLFAIVQVVTILLMVPALFGGAIADEKQRKTLHYLMASRLSSFEIVVDKVLGRSAHLATFLMLGVPVICLLGLFGGVSPASVAIAYVGTISTATMAVALTVLVSTVSRKVRQAVLVAYVLMLAWQFVPLILSHTGRVLFPGAYAWIEPINTLVGSSSPLWAYYHLALRQRWGGASIWSPLGRAYTIEVFLWMIGLQLGAAALMVLGAVWRLRPAFRRHEATQPRRKWFGDRAARRPARAPRWWDRPACGEDAMLWKERYFARTDVFTKLVVLPATVFLSVVLILGSGLDESLLKTLGDLRTQGLRGWGGGEVLVAHLRVVTAWYVAIWLLAVAGASASSLTVEREEDTWVSLTSTPLTAWEIVRGKVLGAVWAQRGFVAIPLGLWGFGLVTGALHPLGFVGAVAMLALASWLVAAVGVHASSRAPSTSKALAATFGALAVLFGYPAFLIRSFLGFYLWENYTSFVGFPPRLAVGPLATPGEVAGLWRTATGAGLLRVNWLGVLIFGGCLAALYLLVAALLTYRVVDRFDAWLDRPRLTTGEGGPGLAKPVAPGLVESAV